MKEALAVRNSIIELSAEQKRSTVIMRHLAKGPEDIWASMVFCILSSQVHVDTAREITQRVLKRVPFFEDFPVYSAALKLIEEVMGGNSPRHRFPNTKASQLASAWFSFAQVHDEIMEIVYDEHIQEQKKRSFLCESFKGLGMKQASMLLRDLGAAKSLAIIDSHIALYLAQVYDFEPRTLSCRVYLDGERLLLREADIFGVDLAVYDTWIWSIMRQVRGRRRA